MANSNNRPKLLKNPDKYAEKAWKVLTFLVGMVFLMVGGKIYRFHTHPDFQDIKKADPKDIIIFSMPFAILYMILDYLCHYLFDDWVDKNFLRQDKYREKEAREKKSYSIVKWGFAGIYYTITSIFAYILLRDSYFLPPFLGGHGSVFTLAEHRYLEGTTEGMKILYLIQMGKHLARFFLHLFVRSEGGYYQFALHHTLSILLILNSYTMNMWVIGIFVMFVHNLPDGLLGFGRAYRQYRYKKPYILYILFIISGICWIGFRNIIFTYCGVYASWSQYFPLMQVLTPVQREVFQFPYIFMSGMLTMLEVMHIYWSYYIIQSFISALASPKQTNHSYD